MYKPPENSNRVKSIKSKFENIENKNRSNKKNDLNTVKGVIISDRTKQNVSRQLSDPAKRNIKRTPAFRIDKNNLIHRSTPYNRSSHFNKVEQISSALKSDCDNNRNVISRTENSHNTNVKPVLIKSKSSHDFAYIRSKFDKNTQIDQKEKRTENQRQVDTTKSTTLERISSLYTEPVPKALRNKISDEDADKTISNDIYNCNTLKICDPKPVNDIQVTLTDTLKAALNRPLPKGPAPEKPPRTFRHTQDHKKQDPSKNTSFLHQASDKTVKPPRKHDPRYMLTKLENALRNNKIRTRRQAKLDASTTSGEDSDDSLLFKSKSQKPPMVPEPPDTRANTFNFNCLHGLCKTTYERIKEPNSSFFVSCEKDEHVYAEPFSLSDNASVKTDKKSEKSLYYMSTPLLNNVTDRRRNMDENLNRPSDSEAPENQKDATHKQMSTENSSLSSFTSDLDSTASSPQDEQVAFEASFKIKQLINTFEARQTSGLGKNVSQRSEELKLSLQKTLEKFMEQQPTKAEESEEKQRKVSVDRMIDKFQTYVKTMPKYQTPQVNQDDRLFYCCLVVGWDAEMPQIKFKFPENATIPARIEDLCYPEAASGPLDISYNAQCYTLVITNDKGERTFGYCRRVIPEGSTRCIPLAYCILSKYRAPRFYKRILTELESRHGIPDKLRNELISEFYYKKFPLPGQSIKINLTNIFGDLHPFKISDSYARKRRDSGDSELVDSLDLTSFVHVSMGGGYGSLKKVHKAPSTVYENIVIGESNEKFCSSPAVTVENDGITELILTLHQDTRYEEADLKPLHELPPAILLKIFASLLLERKVILISCMISKLSCCVDALQSILYPFSWPHTFIPILPECLWEVVESPTPVICGILSVSVVNDHKIEHGIVVDLDSGNILVEEGDENSILSDSMKKAWSQGIALAKRIPPEDYVHSVYLSDAYIQVFIASLKHYKTHIVNNSFEKDSFIRNGKTRGIRRFLKWFSDTTMFLSFIDSVMNSPDSFALFDNKIEMYGSEESNVILTKLLEWKK